MIAHIKGLLQTKSTNAIIIDNGGIGYEVITPLSTFYALPEEGQEVSLHVYTHVREDAFILFGFMTEIEKKIFKLLITVSGIGPKLAINILSGIGPDELLSCDFVRGRRQTAIHSRDREKDGREDGPGIKGQSPEDHGRYGVAAKRGCCAGR